MSGQGKRWPGAWRRAAGEWQRDFTDERGVLIDAATWVRVGSGGFEWRAFRVPYAMAVDVRTGTAPTEAEAMAAADEALFQMLVGVGPWHLDDVGDPVRHWPNGLLAAAVLRSGTWAAYSVTIGVPATTGQDGADIAAKQALADVALRRLAGYPDDATTPPPATEPTPAPAPEPPAPAPLLADEPEPTDPEALHWCIQARLMLAHVAAGNRLDGARDALGAPISHDALLTAVCDTLRQYGQVGTVAAFERGRLEQHQREAVAREQMAEAVARREAEAELGRYPLAPDGVAFRFSDGNPVTDEQRAAVLQIVQRHGIREQFGRPFAEGRWLVWAWSDRGQVKPEHQHHIGTGAALSRLLAAIRGAGVALDVATYDDWSTPF
jgi:hypothetical protein